MKDTTKESLAKKTASELVDANKEILSQKKEIKQLDKKLEISQEKLNIQEELTRVQEELLEVQGAYYIEKKFFEATLFSIGDAVISCDKKGNILFINKVGEELTGWTLKQAEGQPITKVFNIANETTGKSESDIVEKSMKSGKILELKTEVVLTKKNGKERLIEDSVAPIFQEDGTMVGAVVVFRDFSEKWERLKKIEHLSYHDELTGVYNRRFYEEELQRLDVARNLPLSLAMGDVNGLKLINDAFGHKVGDELLVKVAHAIKEACREDDIIARVGGDEFVIVFTETPSATVEQVIERIKSLLAQETINGLDISISFGFATKTSKNESIQQIFKQTEDQMYRIKLNESTSMKSKIVDLAMHVLFEKSLREMKHSQRVGELCEAISEEMGLRRASIDQITLAGTMHDIGKIGINDKILTKKVKLNSKEKEQIRKHPEIGYRILNSVTEFSEISEFVLEHQEWWDGSGYPRGLNGEEIKLEARIIAVADAYDAMTTERTYRSALTPHAALREIQEYSGKQFDPDVVNALIIQVSKPKH